MTEHVEPAELFAYRAVRDDGAAVSGSLRASTAAAAAERLRAEGLWVVRLEASRVLHVNRSHGQSMPAAQQALGLRMLAEFLESGIPLARALAALDLTATPAWRRALPFVREAVREGRGLATALEHAAVQVSETAIGVIRAGEAGTGLASAVRAAAELAEQAAAMRSAIRDALAYPLVLALSGSASIALIVGVVLPRFAQILAELGQSLPNSTRAALALSSVAWHIAPWALVIMLTIVLAWRAWISTSQGLRAWHSLLLEVPIIGTIRRAAATSRMCGALSALLASGLPIAPALTHAISAAGDASLSAQLQHARRSVIQGERLSSAITTYRAATETVASLVRAGEESGRLAPMLAHAARLERENALARTRAAVRLLEPALILIFGVIVSFVAAALLQALYSVRPVV